MCYKCKLKEHLAVDCKSSELKKLKMYGFGVLGQGFYAFNFPEHKVKIRQTTSLLTVIEEEATKAKLDRDLKNLVNESWDFKVRKIHPKEFIVVFPDKGSLDAFNKLSKFQMSIYGLKEKIEETNRDPETLFILQTFWLKVHNIPNLAKEEEEVKEIVGLVVEPLVVDELSLVRAGPIRVQSRCRNPGAIKGSIKIFFDGVGTFIRFEVEGGNLGTIKGKGGPPGPGKPDDKADKDRDKFSKGDKSKGSSDKFNRIGKIDQEMESG
ncbi:unnamed protein product [Miscanthus lutarioriparius]|uniref:CCHC-type domain-containing protein n=1 Tax=Miscanthus lutarioriparius TaxID=422564 RepID=A0A811RQV8_9POAL|nr:unnamed protein product [Miscanthus lutarioriparius]